MTLEEALGLVRGAGWSVAVHNDYVQDGKFGTFWGFSRLDEWVKGKGASDIEAICNAFEFIKERTDECS